MEPEPGTTGRVSGEDASEANRDKGFVTLRDIQRAAVRLIVGAIGTGLLLMTIGQESFRGLVLTALLCGCLIGVLAILESGAARKATGNFGRAGFSGLAWLVACSGLLCVKIQAEYTTGMFRGGVQDGLQSMTSTALGLTPEDVLWAAVACGHQPFLMFARLKFQRLLKHLLWASCGGGTVGVLASVPIYQSALAGPHSGDAANITVVGFALIALVVGAGMGLVLPVLCWVGDRALQAVLPRDAQAGRQVPAETGPPKDDSPRGSIRLRRASCLALTMLLFGLCYLLAAPNRLTVDASRHRVNPGQDVIVFDVDSPRWGDLVSTDVTITRLLVDGIEIDVNSNWTGWADPRGKYGSPTYARGRAYYASSSRFPFRTNIYRSYYVLLSDEAHELRIEGVVNQANGGSLPFVATLTPEGASRVALND